jgi:hypothetical protein
MLLFDHIPSMRYVLTINPLLPCQMLRNSLGGQWWVVSNNLRALHNLEVFHFGRGRNSTQLLHHLLYAPATRDLCQFNLYPLQSDVYKPDTLDKHPS